MSIIMIQIKVTLITIWQYRDAVIKHIISFDKTLCLPLHYIMNFNFQC